MKHINIYLIVILGQILTIACNKETLLIDPRMVSVNSLDPEIHYTQSYVDCLVEDTILNNGAIEGYSDKQSYYPGETIRFYVHSNQLKYTIQIYRFGETQELLYTGKELNGKLQNYFCYSYSWGCNWKNNYSFTIPGNFKTGMYSAKLITNNGDYFWITFVVKPKRGSHKDILVLSNTNTWQAYNRWGVGHFTELM